MRSLGNSVDNYLRVIIGAVAFLLFAKYEYNAFLAIAFEVILVIISNRQMTQNNSHRETQRYGG